MRPSRACFCSEHHREEGSGRDFQSKQLLYNSHLCKVSRTLNGAPHLPQLHRGHVDGSIGLNHSTDAQGRVQEPKVARGHFLKEEGLGVRECHQRGWY